MPTRSIYFSAPSPAPSIRFTKPSLTISMTRVSAEAKKQKYDWHHQPYQDKGHDLCKGKWSSQFFGQPFSHRSKQSSGNEQARNQSHNRSKLPDKAFGKAKYRPHTYHYYNYPIEDYHIHSHKKGNVMLNQRKNLYTSDSVYRSFAMLRMTSPH